MGKDRGKNNNRRQELMGKAHTQAMGGGRLPSYLSRRLESWLTPFVSPKVGVEEGMERHLGCPGLADRGKSWRMGKRMLGNGSTAQIALLVFTRGPQYPGIVALN